MATVWHERGQYGNMIKDVLASQIKNYVKEPDKTKKTKIAQSIGYLAQTLNSLITSFEETRRKSKAQQMAEICVEEDVVKEITREQVINKLREECSERGLLTEIIKLKKCDVITAEATLWKMKELGLNLCTAISGGFYSIVNFGLLRGYVTEEEVANAEKKRRQKEKEMEEREKQLEGIKF